jgi:hypothetical protein
MQHFLKPLAGVARTRVVAAELLEQLLAAVHHAIAALHPGFGWISAAALARDLKSRSPRIGSSCSSWHAPSVAKNGAHSAEAGFVRQEIFLDFTDSRINNARPLANLQRETDANFE